MKTNMKSAVSGLVLAALAPFAAQAENLIVPSFSPAGGDTSTFFNEWASKVNADSNGTLNISVRDGVAIANLGNILDRVENDIVQIGWMIPNIFAGRFDNLDVISAPGVQAGVEIPDGTEAAWKLKESGMLDEEFAGLKILSHGVTISADLHCNKELKGDLSDLSGVKIGVSGGMNAGVVQRLGATPVSLGFFDLFEGLQRGTIDCITQPYAPFVPAGFAEVTNFHVPLPLGAASTITFMQQDRFDALPDDAKAAIEANSGLVLATALETHFGKQDAAGFALVDGVEGHVFRDLTDEELAVWYEKGINPTVQEFLDANPGSSEILESYKEILAAVQAE